MEPDVPDRLSPRRPPSTLGIDGRSTTASTTRTSTRRPACSASASSTPRSGWPRGVCLDIAALEGTAMLEEGFAITVEHIEAACERQGVDIGAGDVVLFHTGWSSLWMVDNSRYGALEPGLGWDGAHWLTERRVSLVGADNWGPRAMAAGGARQAARRPPAPALRDRAPTSSRTSRRGNSSTAGSRSSCSCWRRTRRRDRRGR